MSEWMVEGYNVCLEEMVKGEVFEMVGYGGWYMRVEGDDRMGTVHPSRLGGVLPLNDDGCHVPVVSLGNGNEAGKLFWMAKTKPCRMVGG